MIGRSIIIFGALLMAWTLAACGTIEVGVADEANQDAIMADNEQEYSSTEKPATETPQPEPTSTPAAAAEAAEVTVSPSAAIQEAPADWQRFHDDEYGLSLWHPAGTTAVIGEPARPEFSSVDFPEGIVEEQVFVVRVMQEEGGAFGPPGPMAILEVKLVARPQSKDPAEMAELYSKRCPGPVVDPLQPTTVNAQLSGYRFGCEGIDGIVFNEFWSAHPGDTQLLLGAAWAAMSAPLADEILATVALAS